MTNKKKKFKTKEKIVAKEISENEIPVDVENEQYILACVLKFKSVRKTFYDDVDHWDFMIENHKAITWCIKEAISRDRQVTPEILHILVGEYEGDKKFTGLKYLYELISSQEDEPDIKNFQDHITKLKSDKIKNSVYYGHANRLINSLRDPHTSVEKVISDIDMAKTYIEGKGLFGEKKFHSLKDMVKQHNTEIERREEGTQFMSTGYRLLNDHLTEGFAKKRISIIAGRPGMCKSALVDNVILRLGKAKIPVALFSLEMDRIASYDRFISIESEVPLKTLIRQRDKMTEKEKKQERSAKFYMSRLPIYIFDKAQPPMEMIERQLRSMKEQHGIQVAFIDLFMKIQKPYFLKGKSTADQISWMLDKMQSLSKELDMHIGLVVQIGRKAETRKGKKPQLSDLKDSGAYEEVADLIMLLYRDSYYIRDENDKKQYFDNTHNTDPVEIHIAKQRQGEGNVIVKLNFIADCTKIDIFKNEEK